ncbi:MAG: aminoacyl-tRNA hydrolase [Clostridia bacterium]|nr:aminoacyl-tRNA hydrolase [Clostridia bacterium]
MKLIIGLGNPGREYEHSRHNAGFDVMSILSEKAGIPVKKIRCKALVGEGVIDGNRVALALPQTFMNLSGEAVTALMQWYKVPPEDTLIILDDIDLKLGQMRIRAGGSAGTHNGMRNIIYLSGSDRFPRVRIGVGAQPPEWDLKDWVLSSYHTAEERAIMYDTFLRAADAALFFASHPIDLVMNRFNVRHPEDKA